MFFHSALREDGWFLTTRRKRSIDKNGNPIPWITYPCIDFLKTRITKNMSVFEYGAGGSSIWLANLAYEVDSVEHDEKFYSLLSQKTDIPSNLNIHLSPLHDSYKNLEYEKLSFLRVDKENTYVNAVKRTKKKYHIILVDGVFRTECISLSINEMHDDGIIILDNTNYIEQLSECFENLNRNGFKRLDFWGMTPIIWGKSCTSIFYKKENCLGI